MKALLWLLIFNYFIPMTYPPEALATNYKFHFPTWEMTFIEHKQDMVVEATAYAEYEDGGITCFGKPIVAGKTLAVDPKVIPYGSSVYFHSTGETYIAGDCGGAIIGHRVDKAMKTDAECRKYGRRTEKVTVTFPDSKPIFIKK